MNEPILDEFCLDTDTAEVYDPAANYNELIDESVFRSEIMQDWTMKNFMGIVHCS